MRISIRERTQQRISKCCTNRGLLRINPRNKKFKTRARFGARALGAMATSGGNATAPLAQRSRGLERVPLGAPPPKAPFKQPGAGVPLSHPGQVPRLAIEEADPQMAIV